MKKARNPEWITYKARFNLDGQSVLGTGRTKKDAEASAARKFINKSFEGASFGGESIGEASFEGEAC